MARPAALTPVARRVPEPRPPVADKREAILQGRHAGLRPARLLQCPGRRRRQGRRRRRRHRLPVLPQQGRPARVALRTHDEGRHRRRPRLRSSARPTRASGCCGIARLHLERLGRDRDLAVVFQVELRQSTKFMERFSSSYLREYLGIIRDAVEAGQAAGLFRRDVSATTAAKILFGALDEMATNWMLSRRRYSLEADADAVIDLFLNGVAAGGRARPEGRHDHPLGRRPRRRHDGRADRAAPGQRRCAVGAARRLARRRPSGPRAGAAPQARPAVHARRLDARHHRQLRRRPGAARRRGLGGRSRGRTARREAGPVGPRRRRWPARHDPQHQHVGDPGRRHRRRLAGRAPARGGSARTSSTRPATCRCSS